MKIKNTILLKKLCLASVLLFSSAGFQSASAAVCAAGANWVDNCAAGIDDFNLTGAFGLNFTGLGFFDITVNGSGTVLRSDPYNTDTLSQIDTEILSAVMLTNNIPGAGVITARFGTDAGLATPTLGAITETADSSIALSYFDIFLEVDTPLGVFNSAGPLRFAAEIGEWLPGEAVLYRLDAANSDLTILNSGGLAVAFVDDLNGDAFMSLTAVPVPPSVFLMASGLIGLIGMARRKKLLQIS